MKNFDEELRRCGVETMEGMNYVKRGVDPFHTGSVPAVGLPDNFTGKSLVYDIERKCTITKDSTLPAGNWDCHIAFLPVMSDTELFPTEIALCNRQATFTPNGAVNLTAPLCAFSVGAGVETYSALVVTAHINGITLQDMLSDFTTGSFRAVGGAFKVVNSTADIYRQGQVQCYRQSTAFTDQVVQGLSADATPVNTYAGVRTLQSPPRSIAQSAQLKGETWEAADGCLVPIYFRPSTPQVPTASMAPCLVTTGAGSLDNGRPCYMNKIYQTTLSSNANSISMDADICGAYFTGLSDQTSLEVTLFISLEFFPSLSDQTSLALCRTTPMYDPKALVCYNHLMDILPVAAKADENAAGDWLKRAIAGAKDLANEALKVNKAVNPYLSDLAARSGNPLLATLKNVSDALPKPAKGKKVAKKKPKST